MLGWHWQDLADFTHMHNCMCSEIIVLCAIACLHDMNTWLNAIPRWDATLAWSVFWFPFWSHSLGRFLCIRVVDGVLWHCWLGGRKGIRLVKKWVVGCWHGYLSGARSRLAYGSLPLTVSCFSKIQIGFTFPVPADPGSPGQRAVKWVCVCMCSWRSGVEKWL